VVEHILHTDGVAGSNPAARTIIPEENGGSSVSDTVQTHETTQIGNEDVNSKWPRKFKHRNKVLAKVYRPCEGCDSYRVFWEAAEKRQMKSLPNYSGKDGAKEYAEELTAVPQFIN
jgi:hypothetical protein